MENRSHALAAGAFALLFLLLTALALWWFSGRPERSRELLLVTERAVNGLNAQAQVRYRGIRAGKVEEIYVDPDDPRLILVRVSVSEEFPITQGTRAALGIQGVTGIAHVRLDDDGRQPDPLTAEDGQLPRIPLRPHALDALTESGADMLKQLQGLTVRVDRLLSDHNVARIEAILANLEHSSQGLRASAQQTPALVESLRQVLNPDSVQRIRRILANFEKTTDTAAPAIDELRQTVRQMERLARRLDEGAGAGTDELMGQTLPELRKLLKDLGATSRQLSSWVEELERSPSMLLRGRVPLPPGPGEPGYPQQEPGRHE